MTLLASLTTTAYQGRFADFDGSVHERELSTGEADALISSALFDEDEVVPATDRSGALTLVRVIEDQEGRELRRTVTLTPPRSPQLSGAQYAQLADVRAWEEFHPEGGSVDAEGGVVMRFVRLSPTVARRLVARGWLLVTSGPGREAVTVSYAGRVAMALREHRTQATVVASDGPAPGGLSEYLGGGHVFVGSCFCGWRTEVAFESRSLAQGHAATHRGEELVRALGWEVSEGVG
ncbi:hypothetical protein [Streptomyces noursei]